MSEKNILNKIEGAIFDLDGTILDSMFIWNDIGYKFLEMKKIKVPAGADKQFTQMSLQQAAEYYIAHFDNTATIKSIISLPDAAQHSRIPVIAHRIRKVVRRQVQLRLACVTME